MWIMSVVSSWATSVSIIVLMLLFCTDSGIAPMVVEDKVGPLLSYKGVMATFADPVIMLFIGGFVLAIAATKTGLDAQLAKVLLKPFGTRSEMVLLGFLLITGLFSMFVSNTATAAMMLTFLTPVFRQLPPEGKGRISLAMSIPIAANLGGMGTPIGTPPNTIALKYLNDPEGLNLGLGFGQWMMFMFPLVIILLFISWRLLLKFFPFTQKTVELKIEDGMAFFTGMPELETEPLPVTFADGALCFQPEENVIVFTLQLLEDGALSMRFNMIEFGPVLYLFPAIMEPEA
jgi:sodium-dependent dicarboxylate transporter 2/3/5